MSASFNGGSLCEGSSVRNDNEHANSAILAQQKAPWRARGLRESNTYGLGLVRNVARAVALLTGVPVVFSRAVANRAYVVAAPHNAGRLHLHALRACRGPTLESENHHSSPEVEFAELRFLERLLPNFHHPSALSRDG